MTATIKPLHTFFILLLFCPLITVDAKHEDQPKIVAKNGDLILEAAIDQNISLRLSPDSALLLNNVDLMKKIKHHYTPPLSPDSSDGELNENDVLPPTEQIQNEVRELQDDINQLSQRWSPTQSHGGNTVPLGAIRRQLGNLKRLNGQLKVLKRELDQDECSEASCMNGGTCHDSYKDFYCDCPEGWTGKTCEEDVDECLLYAGTDLECQNRGVCINKPGSYSCQCTMGYAGKNCRYRSLICHHHQSDELCGHGTCVSANNQHGYTCICDQGWSRNESAGVNSTESLMCQVDVNECEESKNPCHSECENLPGGFKCGPCPAGYTGNGITCVDIDECATNNGGCSLIPKVHCINTEGSYRCGKCPDGWIGDGQTCNLAPSNSCDSDKICHPQAKCEYISTVPTCTCPASMFGHGFGPDGCHTTPIDDPCQNHICKNNGTCLSSGRTTSCLCPFGYSGALCETSDACHPNPCENDGECRVMANQTYKCLCSRGNTGKHCEVQRSVCGTIQRQPSGELTYPPSGSSEYASNERCMWLIRTSTSDILNLTFTLFDIQDDVECNKDWLQIHDGSTLASPLLGRFCGQNLPLGGNILSSQHQLFFWFRSDNATNRPGFHMKWQSQPHVCGGELVLKPGDEGVIRSPGYPGKTPPNRDCQWTLTAPYGFRFVIRMYEVNLGTVANCAGDSLKFFDAHILLMTFCSSSLPEPFKSTSNELEVRLHTDSNAVDSSFQLHYEVTSSLPQCGGIFTEPSGIIIEPIAASRCLYLIEQPLGTQIRLEFQEMQLAQTENCDVKSIEIFDGKSNEDNLLHRSCFDSKPAPIVSTSNTMMLRYISNSEDIENKPFRFKFTRICESFYSGPNAGEFTTLNYPKAYVENLTCTYHIQAPDEYIVHANFTDFSIAQTRSSMALEAVDMNSFRNMSQDEGMTYVDVHLSPTNKQRYYSGAPMTLVSEHNLMTIVFHATTNAEKARGFRVRYFFEKLYNGGVYTKDKGRLSNYMYVDNKYIIEAPQGMYIHLRADINIIDSQQGTVLIYGNATARGDYLLKNITTDEMVNEVFHYNVITIFTFNHAYWNTGADYEFVSPTQSCGGNFTGTYGEIKSPNWPDLYAPNLDCIWVISAPVGKQIELVVQNFTLEENCIEGDVLEIRNGMFDDSPLIGRYCTNVIPARIPSFTNHLHLRFRTNKNREGSGFLITWEQTRIGCGGKLTSFKGSIHSPHGTYLEPHAWMSDITCSWEIVVVSGSSIAISVGPSHDAAEFCRSNSIKIYDGPIDAKFLLPFNCSQAKNDGVLKLRSFSNEVSVIFVPSLANNVKFVLDYETRCNVTLDHVHGVIESPTVPEKLNCKWEIQAKDRNKLKLVFSHLHIETLDMECHKDYIEIWDMKNEEVLHKYRPCRADPPSITSMGNRLIVNFVKESTRAVSSFRAEYLQEGCGGIITEESGRITSPNAPLSVDVDCEWYFKVPAGRQVVLRVVFLEMDILSADCSADALIIKEHKNSSHVLTQQCATKTDLMTITSPSNQLYVHFFTSPNKVRKRFDAQYNTTEAKCGGMFKSSFGVITSPHYPLNLTQQYNCVWSVSVPFTYGVVLNLTDVQISESENCQDASLKISEFHSDKEILLRTICSSSETISVYAPFTKHILIEFTNSGPQSWGKFSLEFSKQCGGLITKDSGYLMSDPSDDCVWWFDVLEGTVITFTIRDLQCYCHKDNDGKKQCTNGLGFKETPGNANYTQFLCEEHPSSIAFEATALYVFANGIKLRAQYSITTTICGGYPDAARGTIVSPGYPGNYPQNIDCMWYVSAPPGGFVEIKMYEMDIAETDHCNMDYLEFLYGEKSVIYYCGHTLPDDTLISEGVTLRFHSSGGGVGAGFKVKWNLVHMNEIVNKTNGLVMSPSYKVGKNYEEEPFAWRILVEREQFIALHFEKYIDGLTLYDGYDETAMTVSISPSPWRFVSSSNVVYLKTDSDKLKHFFIRWNITDTNTIDSNGTISECHVEEFLMSHVDTTVKSPGYPYGYAENMNCDWIFKPYNKIEHIVCELYEVNLEPTENCYADYLAISTSADLEQWHQTNKICNHSTESYAPFQIIHGTPYIKMNFVSDFDSNGTGFKAVISTKCGANLTESVGFIQGNRLGPFEMDCQWGIKVKPNHQIGIELTFRPSNKSSINDCQEYAIIYDGVDEYAPILPPGKICSSQNVTRMHLNSTYNHVLVKYKLFPMSHSLSNRWNLTYRSYSPCNEEYRLIPEAPTVNVTSPNYPNVPHPYTECEWRIVAPVGEILEIEFQDKFDMNTRHCASEFLEMFDGSTSLARSLGRYCDKPPLVKTTQRVLFMHYLTDVNEPRSGFKARISISKCGGSYSDANGTIMSPGYPQIGGYPPSQQCDFVINQPEDTSIHLLIQDLHLPFDAIHPKSKEFLEIIPIGNENDKEQDHIFVFGNTTSGRSIHLNSNKVIVRFNTFFKSSGYRGFKLKYTAHGAHCKQTIAGDSGYLNLNLAGIGMDSAICEWNIMATKGQRIRLNFQNLKNLNDQYSLDYAKFYIFADPECRCKIHEFNTNSYDPQTVIQSSDNVMVVKIYLSQVEHQRVGIIRAQYSSDELSPCPSNINKDNPSGLIDIRDTQPTFDGPYYCGISASLSGEETLVFNISALELIQNMINTTEVSSAPLMFWDNGIITKYQQNRTNVLQAQNQPKGKVLIIQSQLGHIHRLRMDYRYHQCGGFHKVSWGVQHLNLPNDTHINYGPIMCVWTLQRGNKYLNPLISHLQLSGNFSFTDSCEHEFVLIKRGHSSDPSAVTKICRDSGNHQELYTSDNQYTVVVYQSQNFKYQTSKMSLDIQTTTICGTEVEVQYKDWIIVEIEDYDYKNNVECYWTFSSPPGLHLEFNQLGHAFIEESINCTKDYLEFQRYEGGNWIQELRKCGRVPSTEYIAPTTQVRVLWRTNEAVTARGFSMYVVSRCSRTVNVTNNEIKRIESPASSYGETKPMKCDYIFQTNETEKWITVNVTFKGHCDDDMFNVSKMEEKGTLTNESHCESTFEQRAHKYLKLSFNAHDLGYYSIEYRLEGCGGNITTSGARIWPKRQNSKDMYDNEMDCVWFVTAPIDHSIAVRFKYFETYDNYDHVSIYMGNAIDRAHLVAKLYGNHSDTPPVIMVDNNVAIINAVSNFYYSAKGFEAEIIFLHNCNERISLTDETSAVTLTRNFKLLPGEELICTYSVTAPKNQRIRIELKNMQINNSSCIVEGRLHNGSCNAIDIFDSLVMHQASLGTFHSMTSEFSSVLSSYEDAKLMFKAYQPGNLKFEITLSMVKSKCGEVIKHDVNGEEEFRLTFPQKGKLLYEPNVHCTWRLPLPYWMNFHFTLLDLQPTSQLTGDCADYLEIKEKFATHKYCGHSTNFTTNVFRTYKADNVAEITFHSDDSIEAKGFELIASRFKNCNRTFSQLNGVIDYSMLEGRTQFCTNKIVVPDNYMLNIYVTELGYENSDCDKKPNKIIDLGTNKTLSEICISSSSRDTSVFTTTNAIRLDFIDFATIYYSTIARNATPGCGGTWRLPTGFFTNPPYNNDRNYSECRWDIIVPPPNKIRINFYDFDMGSPTNCHTDNLKILQIQADGSETVMHTLCGSDRIDDIASASNRLAILSKKSPNFDGAGWALEYHVIASTHNSPEY